MKTVIPERINSVTEAMNFMKELYDNGESFHPEDSAFDIIKHGSQDRLFTDEEAEKIDERMLDISALLEHFDPCSYLLRLDKRWQGLAVPPSRQEYIHLWEEKQRLG